MAKNSYYNELHDSVLIFSLYLYSDINEFRIKHPGCKLIVYQMEPLCTIDHWWKPEKIIAELKKADEVWDYDYQNVILLKLHGINAKFKPFLYTSENEYRINDSTRDIDVLFYGTASPKRGQWLSDVLFHIHETVNAVCLTNIFHPTIENYINRSKIIINIHNAPSVRQQEQPRLGYLLTNGKHIISEKSSINYYGDLITEVNDWKEMVITIHDILKNYDIENEKNIKNRFSQISYDDITTHAKQELETKILK
jgi:hypothetical protein